MKKDFSHLLVAKISKKEVLKKHPDWLVDFQGIKILKNEVKEDLKKILISQIVKKAKEENYYIFEQISLKENDDYFCAFALAYPRFIPGTVKKLKPPKISPERIIEIFKEKLNEYEIIGVSSEGIIGENKK